MGNRGLGRAVLVLFAFTLVALPMLLVLPGCGKPSQAQIEKVLTEGGQAAAFYGLKEWAKKDKPAADEAADRLQRTIDDTILPYLNGADLPSSDLVREFVDSTLFQNIKPELADAIVTAAVALDVYLPAPDPTQKLSPVALAYLKAFLTGLSNGCDKYLKGADKVPVPKQAKDIHKLPKSKWLTGKTAKRAELILPQHKPWALKLALT